MAVRPETLRFNGISKALGYRPHYCVARNGYVA